METFISFLIAATATFYFVRRYVRSLALARTKAAASGSGAAAAIALPTRPCPRCSKPVPEGTAFCGACGAPIALWTVHRATVQATSSGPAEKGKPKPVINATLCIGCGSCIDVCPETGTLELVAGKAILAHAERCTGHAKCAEVCPTQAIALSFGGVLQTLKVPSVDENFETNVSGVFIAGELGGMGLIKTAINEGRLCVDRVKERLAGLEKIAPNGREVHDLIIVGSGPAGLSATLSAHQYELDYLTLEQGEIASTIRNYPRHKFLMAEPLEMPLYGNLYIADSTKEALLAVWETIIANTGVKVRTNTKVEGIRRDGEVFQVDTSQGPFYARFVLLATGKRGSPRKLGAPGEELAKVSYRLIEADSYDNNDLLVVGGGDSAIEAALALSKSGKNRVALSYRGDSFVRARERNQAFLADAEADGRIKVLRKSNVVDISGDAVVIECDGARQTLKNDFVFVLIGGESPEGFLRKVGIEIVEKAVGAAPSFG